MTDTKKSGRGNRSARRGHRGAKEPGERSVRRQITLPPEIDAAVIQEAAGKPFSQALADLLRTHPALAARPPAPAVDDKETRG